MLAALYRTTGPAADVLTVERVPRPEPGPGEVRVRLRVAGVNPTDWRSRTTARPGGFQIPGQDGAGEIDAVGEGVPRTRVGERVWVWFAAAHGRRHGTAAQWTVVPAAQAVRMPDCVRDDVGASLGIPAMTAWCCVFGEGPIAGSTVLVAGGGGAVGSAAVALARDGAATVVATARRPVSAELASAAGAHYVVDPSAPDAAEQILAVAPGGVARVLEVALGSNLALDLAVLAPAGTIVTYAADVVTDLPVRDLMVANATLRFFMIYGLDDRLLAEAVAGVSSAAERGLFDGRPVTRYALEDVAAAHDAVEDGLVGKALLILQDT